MSNTIRWIIFIPCFIVLYIIVKLLAILSLVWLYEITFPISGFFDFITSGLYLMIMLIVPILFASGLLNAGKICPNYKLGARIMIAIIMLPILYFYFNSNRDYSLIKYKIEAIIDILTFIIMLVMCFNEYTEDLSLKEKYN